jgi:16S rRNA (uracil1498-N3)-methyltransferase
MRIPRVFVDTELGGANTIALPREQSHYLSRVLRLRKEAPVILFNGRSARDYAGHIEFIDKSAVCVRIEDARENHRESPLVTHIGIGLSKGDRMDWAIQKATELGITSITPLFTQRCEVKLSPARVENRLKHWRQVAISACEQSGRSTVPEIGTPITLQDWTENQKADLKLVLHPEQTTNLSSLSKPDSVCLLIGPEGGFTEEEIELALRSDYLAAGLGPRILRTETAPVAALSLLQFLWGDF